MSDNALGKFLRARREATAPTAAGPSTGPRRTPGLRRSELATLSGISVEYLTRLERGTDRRPSGQVLGALADVLRLSADERIHLYRLVKISDGSLCTQASAPVPMLRPAVRALLGRLEPTPAYVIDPQTEVLAHTEGFRRLVGSTGFLDTDSPNLARFVFTDARAREMFPEWERLADEQAAALRAAADLGDVPATALADELSITAGAEFSRRFTTAATLPPSNGVERWTHPAIGELRLAYESLAVPGADELRLVVHLPADAAASAALEALAEPAVT